MNEQARKLVEELEAHERDGLTTVTLGVPLVRALVDREERLREALERVAVCRRPDGTFNLGRDAVAEIARAALSSAGEAR